ncbi:hypothetical protein HMPREF9443_01451 [Phascolarctobacterium succinatutens YIT 12067]|uniref:Uncharacterized protein n=1 Tax=Phascolarctobacterium succinatutens YIT 12067 TaxID=626939 RepID=E8LF16_9FIRM|nr:hypothetical protein HMPREF9443_01451 [Phascolarctobacterium succinatutens YIT 12067]
MRNVRTYANHIRLQLLQKAQVADKVLWRLVGGAYHEAGTNLITDFLEVKQAALAVFQAHAVWMQLGVMLRIRCFVAQQITVGACIEVCLIAGTAFFANGQCNGAVGMLLADGADDGADFVIRIIRILATLQHEGAEAEPIAFGAAGQDFLLRQTVAFREAVAGADTAVVAVVFAVVGEFNQTTDIDLVAVILTAEFISFAGEQLVDVRFSACYQRQQLCVA